jgi:RNA polymerase sigma factor (sigma-70 family)
MNEPRHDAELLREFSRKSDQAAFTTLVHRHVDLVYATAIRKVDDSGAAEEVAQNVFAALARKAWQFASDDSLPAWLHRTTLLEAKSSLRAELRRRRRERAAAELGTTMNIPNDQTALRALLPLLDEALLLLREKDRTALLLRYYERQSLRDLGAALGIGEDAAQKRVAVALERLARFFQRRGFRTATVAATAAALQHTASPAPAFIVNTVVHAALLTQVPLVAWKGLLGRLIWLTKAQKTMVCFALLMFPLVWRWETARHPKEQRVTPVGELAAEPSQPERAQVGAAAPARAAQEASTPREGARLTARSMLPEREYSVELRALAELPDFKGALVAVHHHSLDRPNAAPFVAKRVLRESELFEDRSVRGAYVRFELLQVAVQAGEVRLRANGEELACQLENQAGVQLPANAAAPTLWVPEMRFSDFADIYAEMLDRSVLCHPAIKASPMSLEAFAADRAEAELLFEQAFLARGIGTVLDGSRFVLLVPTNLTDVVRRNLGQPPVRPPMAEDSLPKGAIYLENVELTAALVIYGELLGRKLEPTERLSGHTISFRGQTSLARAEVLHAFDILLGWQGFKVAWVGDKRFKIVSVSGGR